MKEVDRIVIETIKATINSLPPDQREACSELAEWIRSNVRRGGPVGILALALVGAEFQAKDE